ncbi:SLC13 family permease [Lactobacillaceae bacterium Scapto_B20]
MLIFKPLQKIMTDKLLLISASILLIVCLLGLPRSTDINWATIGSLFALMTVVQLMTQLEIITLISDKLVNLVKTTRQFVQLMISIAFFSAMVMTNDVAIISILPLYLLMAKKYELPIVLPATLITIAANLGSVLTPFGNPQNLFLFNNYHFTAGRFFIITTPIVIVSILLLLAFTWWIPNRQFTTHSTVSQIKRPMPLIITGLLAIIILMGVFDLISIEVMVLITLFVTLFINYKTLLNVDYALLLTFACFFLITGILSRNDLITTTLQSWLHNSTSTYLTSILTSQVISNVPAAVLLSKFTTDGNAILMGVNIGGLGTLVASLANLLALKQLASVVPDAVPKFIKQFTIINILLLIFLGFIGWIMLII